MPYRPILATLGYVLSPDKKNVLLIRRDKRPDDNHFGKCNGLGGKVDDNEDVVASMKREIFEEAGIVCKKMELRGTISWPGFGKAGEDWFAFIFVITEFEGVPHTSNPEGSLFWANKERILELPLWEGDPHFLPLVFGDDPRQFHGIMPYKDGRMVSWNFSWLAN